MKKLLLALLLLTSPAYAEYNDPAILFLIQQMSQDQQQRLLQQPRPLVPNWNFQQDQLINEVIKQKQLENQLLQQRIGNPSSPPPISPPSFGWMPKPR